MSKKGCSAPGGKCINPKTCQKIGKCISEKASSGKPKKPGQVTGKKGGY